MRLGLFTFIQFYGVFAAYSFINRSRVVDGREIELAVRAELGKGACGRYRRAGLIPSVVYGHGQEPVPVTVGQQQFVNLARKSKLTQVISLKSSDARINGRPALVKEIKRDHVNGQVLHVDLHMLRDDEEVRVSIPVKVKGDAVGVKTEGGVLTLGIRAILVSCLPRQIPDEVVVDVTNLKVGGRIRAGEIELPQGVRLRGNPSDWVANVISSKKAEAMMEEVLAGAQAAATGATAATPAEGAATPGAEGATATPAAAEKKPAEKK
jgi:large subunit ribosomal protein L25